MLYGFLSTVPGIGEEGGKDVTAQSFPGEWMEQERKMPVRGGGEPASWEEFWIYSPKRLIFMERISVAVGISR